MHPDDAAAIPPSEHSADARSLTDRQFVDLVRGLARDDPRFVRRVSTPSTGGLARADLLVVVAVLATLLLGIVPLAIGIHLGATALLVVGTIGCVLAPVGVPLLVRSAMVSYRPLWL